MQDSDGRQLPRPRQAYRYHFIRQAMEDNDIVYCPTDAMVVDVLTKALRSWKVKGQDIGSQQPSYCLCCNYAQKLHY